ncbi:antitoxin family protein [Candidatus Peregrinibacteria bacterium]|nr:antitoxin family protein [Candidatus Peregrinibacteria bacterium]
MNPKTLQAVYEQGVLRPLQPLKLREHERVQVTVSPTPHRTARTTTRSCYALARKAGLIEAMKSGPSDLSTNQKHLDGFGQS